jgi:ATP-dependent RNA helicase DeaD
VADLRERRVEIVRANLREALLAGDHDRLRGVVEPLTEEFDLVDIALAAVSLIEGAEVREEDAVELQPAFLNEPRVGGRAPAGRPAPGRAPARQGPRPPGAPHPSVPDGGWVQLWIGGGRRANIRPGDLVGAIANEAGVPGSVVGAIQIFDDFALVDVQASVVDGVAHALRAAKIRGQRLPVRRERPG